MFFLYPLLYEISTIHEISRIMSMAPQPYQFFRMELHFFYRSEQVK